MKKTLLRFALLVLLCMLLTTVCSATAEAATLSPNNTVVGAEDGFIFGDVNLDGAVTNADALALFRYIYDPEQYPLPVLCNHTFGEWTVVEEPDCITDGLQTRTCSKCGGVEENVTEAPGHSYTSTFVPPTATEDGYTRHTCAGCGDTYNTDYITPTDFVINRNNRNWIGYTGIINENLVIPAVFERDGTWYRVTGIGEHAFLSCTNLAGITIPNSVTSIGAYAFSGCSSLTNITIPKSVTSVSGSSFASCKKLIRIDVDSDNTKYASIDGNLYSKDKTTLLRYAIGKTETNFIIPVGTTSIGLEAFAGCTSLISISIPDSVTSIGSDAFAYCSSLQSIVIPNDVTSISNSLFQNCTSLTSISIPNGVTSIGQNAFYLCKSLINITIPDSVTRIGHNSFYGCSSLENITIPNKVSLIGNASFESCTRLTSITIPDSVTSIGGSAFSGCTSLKTVYYTGTPEEWEQISIGYYNDNLTYATRYYYNETQPTDTTYQYWHYVNGVPTKW